MKEPSILAVLINWRRPVNIATILSALRAQTVPVHVALVECAPGTAWALDDTILNMADTVLSIDKRNLGPCSRFLPPLAMPWFDYTFFQVDDFVPGPRCVEYFLEVANLLQDHFSSIGQDGRYFVDNRLVVRTVRLERHPIPVDVITSSELVKTRDIPHAITLHQEVTNTYRQNEACFEDDILLGCGIQRAKQLPSFLTPEPPSTAESWKADILPAPYALCARPDHQLLRDNLMQLCAQLGWQPFRPTIASLREQYTPR